MLDQAADLLDRILRDQAAFDDLGEKLFEIESLKEEIKAYAETVKVALPSTKEPPFGIADKAIIVGDMASEAVGEEYSAYFNELGPLHEQSRNLANLRTPYQDPVVKNSWVEASGVANGGNNDPANLRYQGGKQNREHDLFVLDEQTSASQQEGLAVRQSILNRSRASAIKHAFEVESAKLSNRLRKLKADAAIEPKNALNFKERRDALLARIDDDFREVKARVAKAAIGLKRIYQYDGDLPLEDPDLGLYDRYLISVRRAISHLVAITRRDQQFAITISLKQLMQGKWAERLSAGKWNFRINNSKIGFPAYYRLIRLRGAALSVIYNNPDLTTPDTWTGDIEITTANASARCHAGRISPRQPLREPDLLGEVLLHNINPFTTGEDDNWTVSINQTSLLGQSLTTMVQDVFLDLRIVAQVLGV